jgi:hypothetical protein
MPTVIVPKDMVGYHVLAIEVTTEEAGCMVDALGTNEDTYYELQVLLWNKWREGLDAEKENGLE